MVDVLPALVPQSPSKELTTVRNAMCVGRTVLFATPWSKCFAVDVPSKNSSWAITCRKPITNSESCMPFGILSSASSRWHSLLSGYWPWPLVDGGGLQGSVYSYPKLHLHICIHITSIGANLDESACNHLICVHPFTGFESKRPLLNEEEAHLLQKSTFTSYTLHCFNGKSQ